MLRSKSRWMLLAAAAAFVASSPGRGAAQPALTQTLQIVTPSEKTFSVSYPGTWSIGHPMLNAWVILDVPADQLDMAVPSSRVVIGYLERRDHEDAMAQLTEYARESSTSATTLSIDGWPALQRVQLVLRPQPGEGSEEPLLDRYTVQVTTAVAADDLLVRLEANLPSDADQQAIDRVLAMGQSLVFVASGEPSITLRDLGQLDSAQLSQGLVPGTAAPLSAGPIPLLAGVGAGIFPSQQLPNGSNGELEVTISNNGTNIVVVKQSGWVTSNDGGQTFPFAGFLNVSDGDSSIAFAQSGNFYDAALSCFGTSCQPPCPGASPTGNPPSTNNCVVVAPSTTSGRTFGALVNAGVCPNTGGNACFIDQEHIAADRINAGNANADRVYLGARNCQGGCGANGAFVTCSPDSGATWAPLLALEAGSDFPRVAVGGDGFFYVVYVLGGNIRIDKFSACTTSAAQMTRVAGFPQTVSAFSAFAGCEVANGFGGLDRCNDGNILSGPTVTVDDTNSQHLYVAWANNTAANNENILTADSTNGGTNWRAPVSIQTNGAARRYHPWACATGGNAFVTWYDRRAATAANNDLTDYFAASAGLSGGNLVANNDEFKISTASDPQCNLWPSAPRSTFDSENCSVQPQNAGVCKVVPAQTPDPSTNTRCDFAGGDGVQCGVNPVTNTQEQCTTGGGAVKYGDYNGNACILGRLCTVFASGAGLNNIANFFQCFVVAPTPTSLAYTGATTGDYHDAVTLSGVLTLSGTSAAVAGQSVTFTIGTQSCAGTTDGTGFASCSVTLNQVPGSYTVTATFAANGNFQASSASSPFTITKEETTLSYTGPTVIPNNVAVTLSGVLLEDGTVPIAGRSVLFTLGTGGTAQTCTGATDATGTASCTITPVNQPLGPGVVSDQFAGDAFYLPSAAQANTIVFAFLDRGAFVLGDQTAGVGSAVTFWSATWSTLNVLSGGAAPASFKGFASTISTEPPKCGDTWVTAPGNSSRPPDTIPSYFGVLVSSAIGQSGSTISGNVPRIVVVKTGAGYAPDPGHPGTGTVVVTYCK